MSYYSDSPVPGASIQRFRFRAVLWSSSLEESALKKIKKRLSHQRRSGYKLERDKARIAAVCRLCLRHRYAAKRFLEINNNNDFVLSTRHYEKGSVRRRMPVKAAMCHTHQWALTHQLS
jgi:hypothetical protein